MRILFVTNDVLEERRAGPAVRCLELAKAVSERHEVTVASAHPSGLLLPPLRIISDARHNSSHLRDAARSSDVVVVQGLVLTQFPFLSRVARHLVIDLYDPYLLEYLAHPHPQYPEWGYLRQWHRLNQQMLRGDFFLCANERQRDYWLGRLCALGRLDPRTYAGDATFQKLVAVAPFGLPEEPPRHSQQVMKGVIPGIAAEDIVALWAGGIWQWLDPLTPIRAMKEVAAARNDVKLVFLGTEDPNPNNRPMAMVEASRKLAAELQLLDHSIFFIPGWTPYEQRQNYLLESDAGISAHPASIEARFAFRTRVLDYIWAGLPMVLSAGDYFSEWVRKNDLGWTPAPGDVSGWKAALLELAQDSARRQQIREHLKKLAPEFYWRRTAQPLMKYCDQPYRTGRISPLKKMTALWLSAGYEALRRG